MTLGDKIVEAVMLVVIGMILMMAINKIIGG
jgi:hypothetical protein